MLNVACLEWSGTDSGGSGTDSGGSGTDSGFMRDCEEIDFERDVARFYRVKVVGDMLVSMWRERNGISGVEPEGGTEDFKAS